ncbi:aminopeptidase C [Listeria floridensis FSL S10-1187]|uniref:Aminopeptidase n=1 Tax=Listeria floridensis FSL S10-1187 TaxID=1265817 RepID=A0ABP3B2Y9_9LIST|nr:aminopeptidase C [Listeria floridensis]EUJ33662.1 aminopeptidase C [Listeria floridensis FSL S10-1187]
MEKSISHKQITAFSNKLKQNPANQIFKDAIMKNGIKATTENGEVIRQVQPVFSTEIATDKVSNQNQSGRCWMFAALNTFRHQLNSAFGLKDFELSQNYINFWDKFEKANYFLEAISSTSDKKLDSRTVSFLLETPQQDGGQWDMLVSIIEKYGVVPKSAMPETFGSQSSRELNELLNARLRTNAAILRQAKEKDRLALKEDMLAEIYQILMFALGEPPETFDFEYRDNENKYHQELNMTPQTFYQKYIGLNLADYAPVINAPTADKPFNQTFTVDFLGNVVGGKPIKYLNVDIDTLKSLAKKQIASGETVWFGCDVGQSSERTSGIMDPAIFDLKTAFGFKTAMTKAERLDYKESMLTHAMVLTGFNEKNGKVDRWKVENSWGEKVGNNGYFTASDAWMDEFTFQVVIHKKYLSKELQEALKQDPIHLKPWDPMGSLASFK